MEHGYYRRGCINLTTTAAPLTTTTTTTSGLSQLVGFATIQVGEFKQSLVACAGWGKGCQDENKGTNLSRRHFFLDEVSKCASTSFKLYRKQMKF
eukprot:2546273-Amphidinium_carterae.1